MMNSDTMSSCTCGCPVYIGIADKDVFVSPEIEESARNTTTIMYYGLHSGADLYLVSTSPPAFAVFRMLVSL